MSTRVIRGDCREVLATLPDESVHCVVTSPPYWGLRDYGTAKWEGGDPACDHARFLGGNGESSIKQVTSGDTQKYQYRDVCDKCGARRIDVQIGLESTYQEYVEQIVAVFREVHRVLRSDGVCWVNLGDSYAGGGTIGRNDAGRNLTGGWGNKLGSGNPGPQGSRPPVDGLKPKDLVGIPWRVAFALQADGWYLRQDIIWAKPNPMPESVTDRCTKAHEYLFLLSKSERYHYDAEAIKEDSKWPDGVGYRYDHDGNRANDRNAGKAGFEIRDGLAKLKHSSTRNKRSVWEVATYPYPGAHFATFPPALIEPCILAGTSAKGCCAKCGAPWVRETERQDTGRKQKMADGWDTGDGGHGTIHRNGREHGESGKPVMASVTLGWSPSCACDAAMVPCTVLDPFAGAGTTGLVADRLQRDAILIELNPGYAAMAQRRIVGDAPLLARCGS
jgi:DNA modification methylase